MPGRRQRRHFQQIDDFTRGMVIGLKRARWSLRQIAADTHMDASTVHRLWLTWLEQGNVGRRKGAGAARATSARVNRRIRRQAVAVPHVICTAILQHVQDSLDVPVSTRTISCQLVERGLHSRRPLRRLPLTPQHRRQRFEWCRTGAMWMTEWRNVLFSDEPRFCFSSDSRRIRVWRRLGDISNPAVTVERLTARQRGIMVWGAIAYDSRSPLFRIQGTLILGYLDNVLRSVAISYLQGLPNAILQQDHKVLASANMLCKSRFALEPDDKRIRIWREQRTRNQSQNIPEHHTFRESIKVRAWISLGYRADLHIFKWGSLTTVRYRYEVLEPIVRLYAAAFGPSFVLMDDNARPHKSDIVDDYLESEGIARMAWPAYSHDLNPIDKLWDALGRAVSSSFPPPATLIELETCLQEEWRLLDSAVVDHLIESMVTRGFKIVGPFVVMIYKMILTDLLCFVTIYLVFVLGFAQAYYVIFLSYRAEKPSFFDDPIQSVLAMFVMSLSEFGDTYEQFHHTAHQNIAKVLFKLV
ncbi:Transposable element Tc1 transposase, partial [Stegodyphus mimosarum]